MADLKGRSVRGGAVTLAAQAIKFVLQLSTTIILARLLTPADFGLVAMVTAVTGFVSMFSTLGLTVPTIQLQKFGHRDATALFWANVFVGLVLGACVALLGPYLARFYGEPSLVNYTLVLAIGFPVGCAGAQHHAILIRQMRQRTIAVNEILSLTGALIVGASTAIAGYGAWALVLSQLAMNVFGTCCLWFLSGWIPGWPTEGANLTKHLRTGLGVTAHTLLGYVTRNADAVLIGRIWGASPLGIYGRAYQLVLLPIGQITAPLYNVAMPALSRAKDAPSRFANYSRRMLVTMTWVAAPLVAMLACVAPELFTIALGEKWTVSARVFQWLAPIAAFQPLSSMVVWIFLAQGDIRGLLRFSTVFTLILLGAFVVGVPRGIGTFPAIYCGVFLLAGVPWMLFTFCRRARVEWRAVCRELAAPLGVSTVIVAVLAVARLGLGGASLVARGSVLMLLAFLVVGLVWVSVPGFRAVFGELMGILRAPAPDDPARQPA